MGRIIFALSMKNWNGKHYMLQCTQAYALKLENLKRNWGASYTMASVIPLKEKLFWLD